MLVENGQPAEAVRYYTAAFALRPDNPGIYLNRGNALDEAGEVDAAIADYSASPCPCSPVRRWPTTDLGFALMKRAGWMRPSPLPERHRPRSQVHSRPLQPRLGSEGQGEDGRGHRGYQKALRPRSPRHSRSPRQPRQRSDGQGPAGRGHRLSTSEAIRLDEGYAEAHSNLGNDSVGQGPVGRGHRRLPGGHPARARISPRPTTTSASR